MDPFFTELGRTVASRWKARNFSLPAFPEIAMAALEKRPPARHVDLPALLQDFLLEDDQPLQSHSGFGQPELVVYSDPRLYIQILFWLDGTTDIHQHEFSGAFHVLAGSSIHSLFQFEQVQPVSSHLRVGNLRMTETHLLETGSTVPIISGSGYIHSLFHLDLPSATVVVRTQTDPGTGPQFTYLPPHVGLDPIHDDALTMRRKQLLDLIEKTDPESLPEIVRSMISGLDFERGFFILQNCVADLRRMGFWEPIWSAFRKKHGTLADGIPATLDEIARRDGIAAMRATVVDPDHRFFLALLLNVPTGADILAMVAQRFGARPTKTVLRWATELIEPTEDGTWLLDAAFPEELDVPPDDQPALFLTALAHLLGESDAPRMSKPLLATLECALFASSWRALLRSAPAARTPARPRRKG